ALRLAAVGATPDLGVELLVGPSRRNDGMAVDHFQRVVVAALGVFAARQRAPAGIAGPGGDVAFELPLAGAAIARCVADFVHALGPGAGGFLGRQRAHGPGLVGAELETRWRLVLPVLAPVLGHVAALRRHQDVLQDDAGRGILDHDHYLVGAAALGRVALVTGLQQHGLVEGEADDVLALH